MRSFLVVVALLAVSSSAHAGRRAYSWLYSSEVLPERGAEIETWVYEENGQRLGNAHSTLMVWAATVGLTDRLELSLPTVWRWTRDDDRTIFTFPYFGLEARYRFVSPDPVEAPPFAPLVRVAVRRDVIERDVLRAEVDAVGTYTHGRFEAAVDLGVVADLSPDAARFELRPSAGVSIEAVDDLRFGVEAYAQLNLDDGVRSWAIVGPNVALTHGRFWVTATYGLGVYQIDSAPRIVWGIAF